MQHRILATLALLWAVVATVLADNGWDIQASINAYRAYFQLTDPNATVKAFNLNFGEEEATSLSEELSVKSEESADWFDLNGRRLAGKPTQKGMYIHDGKKVFVK